MRNKVDVLLVDDEKIVGNRLKPALTKVGCEVEVFGDPKMALNRISEKEFDIVVTDIVMEGINGIQILEAAQKKSDRTRVKRVLPKIGRERHHYDQQPPKALTA